MKEIVKMMYKARDYIQTKTDIVPNVGIVLGTGLGGLAKEIEADAVIQYSEIPGFVSSTVEFHEGRLIIGTLSNEKVIAMQGRFHYYEGFSMQEITFPIRVMKSLGASVLIISNAAGGMNTDFNKGDLVLIHDHMNLMGDNPLIGVNDQELGSRFPDMSEPYSNRLASLAKEVAVDKNINLREGVYVAVPGPSLETRAEYDAFERAFRLGTEAGKDATGGLYTVSDLKGLDLSYDQDIAADKIIRKVLGND